MEKAMENFKQFKWAHGIWTVETFACPRRVVAYSDGARHSHTDYPTKYSDGNIGYDSPGAVPKRVKAAVARAFHFIEDNH